MEKTIGALNELFSIDHELRERQTESTAAARTLLDRRSEIRQRLSAYLLSTYDSLVRARRFPPVVEVRDGYCGGCNLRLPPQLDHLVRGGRALLTCPHCLRLLHAIRPPQKEPAASRKWSESDRPEKHLGRSRR